MQFCIAKAQAMPCPNARPVIPCPLIPLCGRLRIGFTMLQSRQPAPTNPSGFPRSQQLHAQGRSENPFLGGGWVGETATSHQQGD